FIKELTAELREGVPCEIAVDKRLRADMGGVAGVHGATLWEPRTRKDVRTYETYGDGREKCSQELY
ncbi:MAG TPA: hypothetical protein VF311_13305, partial [Terriglobales bacterium]